MYFHPAVKHKTRKIVTFLGIFGIFLLAGIGFAFRDTYFIRSTVLHIGESSDSGVTSNSIRYEALSQSVSRIIERPFGEGLGTAGPSSLKNTEQKVALTENHFLQVAVELGVLSFIVFMAISISAGIDLFKRRGGVLYLGLFASYTGLLITNNLVHIWSSDAVAYTWWGIAGLVIYYHSTKSSIDKKSHIKRAVNK
jgi:hypothetical protein